MAYVRHGSLGNSKERISQLVVRSHAGDLEPAQIRRMLRSRGSVGGEALRTRSREPLKWILRLLGRGPRPPAGTRGASSLWHSMPVRWCPDMPNYYHNLGDPETKERDVAFRCNTVVWADESMCVLENPWFLRVQPDKSAIRDAGLYTEEDIERLPYAVCARVPSQQRASR